jgi:PAS domain S-box-containing protein
MQIMKKNSTLKSQSKTEIALNESEQRYRTTIMSVGDGVIATDTEGRVEMMNPVAEELTGWKEDEARGKPLEEIFCIINEETRKTVENPVRHVMREGMVVGLANHTVLIAKDSTERPIADSGSPIRNEKGDITGVVLVFRDQTQERITQKALQESEQKYRNLFEKSQVGMFRSLIDGSKVLEVNEKLTQIFGFSREEMIGNPSTILYSDIERRKEMITCLNQNSTLNDFEIDVITKDGSIKTILMSLTSFPDEGILEGSFVDITGRNRAEEALLASEVRYRSYIEATGQIGWVTNDDGEVVEDVPSLRKFTGQTYEEAKGSGWAKTLHPDDLERSLQVWNIAVATKSFYEIEYRMRRHDGVYRDMLARSFPAFREDGSILEWIGTCIDITERKRAEEALRETNEYLESLFNYANAPIIVWDPTLVITRFNHAFEHLSGYSEEEVRGKKIDVLFSKEKIDSSLNLIRKAISGERWETVEIEIQRKDGDSRIVLWNSANIIDKDGKSVVATIAQGNDITERKRVEETSFRLATLVESADDAIIGKDMNGVITSWNAGAEKLFGYSANESVGRSIMQIVPQDRLNEEVQLLDRIRRTLRPLHFETVRLTKDGQLINVSVTSSPIKDAAGNLVGISKVVRDITERKQVETALKTSEERFRIAAETSNDMVYEWDLKQEVKWFGKIDEMLGYAPGEFPRTLDGLGASVHPEDWVRVMASVNAHLVGRAPYAEDYRVLKKDGTFRWWSARGAVARTPEGKPVRWVGTVTDITERKLTEEALSNAELKFRTIFDKASDGMLLAENGSSTFYIANNKICEMLGYTQQEILKIGLSDIHLKKDLPYVLKQFDRLMRNEISLAADIPVLRKDGTVFNADINSSQVNLGGKDYLIGVFRDITERKQMEAAQRDSEERFRTMANSIPQLAWVAHPDGFIYWYNQRWYEYTGTKPEQMEGWGWQIVHDPAVLPEVMEKWTGSIAFGQSFEMSFPLLGADGRFRTFLTRVEPLKDSEGRVVQWFGTNTDVETLKQAEEKVRLLNSELDQRVTERTYNLEAANKELEAFSYSVSHDLRAPLRHVSGYVELLNKQFQSDLPEKGQHYLNSIGDSVHIMGMLIDDLLQFSRTGRMEMHKSDLDMNEIVKEVKESLSKDNPDRKIEWVLGKLPTVNGDEAMLRLVWTNLMSNAVKFTRTRKKARIEIGVSKENKELIFFVRDNGVGFDMKYAHKLFGVFQRLHSMEEFEGTGIGLANVHRIVLRQGGRTWAEAEPDKGAVFYFSLINK